MERTFIAPGVHLSCDPAEKFNRCRISVHFAFPAKRETATACAAAAGAGARLCRLPGYDPPDQKLAKLYGADLTVDARPMGCSHNLCVSVTGIKDQFALEGETLTREYASIALGAAFHPYFVGGTFDPEAVGIEKQMLKRRWKMRSTISAFTACIRPTGNSLATARRVCGRRAIWKRWKA